MLNDPANGRAALLQKEDDGPPVSFRRHQEQLANAAVSVTAFEGFPCGL